MKILILLLYSFNLYAECPVNFLPDVSQIEAVTAKNCLEIDYYGEPEQEKQICECAKKNTDVFPYDSKPNKEAAKKLVENSMIPLLSFSEDLAALSHVKNIQNYNMGTCNIKDKLASDGPVVSCQNSDTVLSLGERQALAEKIKTKFINEMKLKSNPNYIPSSPKEKPYGIYERGENSCQISNESIIKAKKQEAKAAFTDMLKELKKYTDSSNAKNIYDLVLSQRKQFYLDNMADYIQFEPYLRNLLESEDFYQAYISGNTTHYIEEIGKKDYTQKISKRCESIFAEMNKAICVSSTENLSSGTFSDKIDYLLYEAEMDNMEASDYLTTQVCTTKESKSDELMSAIRSNTSATMPVDSNLSITAERYYKSTYSPQENLICDAIKSGLEEQTAKECAKRIEGTELQTPNCRTLMSYKKHLDSQKNELAQTKAIEQLSAQGKTVDLESEEGQNEVKVLASKIINTISDKEVEQYIDKKETAKANSNSTLVSSFLGEKPMNSETPSLAVSSNVKSKNMAKANNVRNASLKNNTSSQKNIIKKAEDIYEEEINSFYADIADKMTQVRQKASSLPESSPERKKLERAIASSYSPTPSESINRVTNNFKAPTTPSYTSKVAPTSSTTSGYGGNSSPTYSQAAGPEEQPETESERIAREENEALNQANAAKAARNIASTSDTIPNSPFSSLRDQIAKERKLGTSPTYSMYKADFSINPETIISDIESLIDNVLKEKNHGVVGENTQHANRILLLQKLLDPKSSTKQVILRDPHNHDIHVEIVRDKDSNSVRLENAANEFIQNSDFYKKIEKYIINFGIPQYKRKFEELLNELKVAVDSGIRVEDVTDDRPARLSDYQ